MTVALTLGFRPLSGITFGPNERRVLRHVLVAGDPAAETVPG